MPAWLHEHESRAAAQRLRAQLSEAGLLRGGRWRRAPAGAAADSGPRLRRALEALGPLAAAFARYLSTRADLLSLEACSALSHTAVPAPVLPFESVRARIEPRLGRPAADALASLDETPLRCDAFTQSHAGRLHGGEAVVLDVLRPEWDVQPDTRWLGALEAAVPGAAEAADDFAARLARRCDLLGAARERERLFEPAPAPEGFAVPRLFAEQSCARLLVREAWEGRPLAGADQPGADSAQQLCLRFFHQALLAGALLEEPLAADFECLSGSRLGLVGGLACSLDDSARRALLEYVSAVAREDPDAAFAILPRLTRPGSSGADRDELRLRLRQAEPLRAGLGFEHYRGRRLAQALHVHLRLARECGFRPRPELLAFTRATLHLERLALDLAPSHDALARGLGDVRLVAAAVAVRELLAPSRLTDNVARGLPPLLDLLQRLERLTLAREHEPAAARPGTPWGAFWARFALLLAVGVAAPGLLAGLGQPWAERLAALALLLAGVWLLFGVRRGERPAPRT